jgi:hypothetical protein
MKHIILTLIAISAFAASQAQVTIHATDMPVAGDTLRYSNANPLTAMVDLSVTGTGANWAYDTLTALSQSIDTYKTAVQVNPIYGATISLAAYGYKTADSIPGISLLAPGVTVSNVYTFYEKLSSPSCFAATAYAATISGLLPLAFNYTAPDAWYFFPLTYGRMDSTDFELNLSLLTLGTIKQKGYRKTNVDGWGVITTPYYATPLNCLRVRSEIHEIDSVILSGTAFGLPRTTVEYKWLAPGQHYPALFVTASVIAGAEVPTSIKYRDVYRNLNPNSIAVAPKSEQVSAYPVPATDGMVTLSVPQTWADYYVEVFDVAGKLMVTAHNTHKLDMSSYPTGRYIARIASAGRTGYVQLER